MIISASRRCDIPAFQSDWFMDCVRTGKCITINPYNKKEKEIILNPDTVDCIVFWTKNPRPLMKHLNELTDREFKYYFHFTITPYNGDIEPNIDKHQIIDTFIELSELISREKVIWRYDPILMFENNNINNILYHTQFLENLLSLLYNYTDKCVISFVDIYNKNRELLKKFGIREPTDTEKDLLIDEFVKIQDRYDIEISTCCETTKLKENKCIDKYLIERIINKPLKLITKNSQRLGCNCYPSIDIGRYGACKHGCIYCYAK